jgi:hypothetical protein
MLEELRRDVAVLEALGAGGDVAVAVRGAGFFAPRGGSAGDAPPALVALRRRIGERPAQARLAWPELLECVFATDVLECPRCRGPMRILATIHPPAPARAILACLGLPVRAPPLVPARRDEVAGAEWADSAPDDLES